MHLQEDDWERIAHILQGQLDQHHERFESRIADMINEGLNQLKELILAAIDDLNTSIAKLDSDVGALIALAQAADQTPAIVAAQASVDAIDAKVTAVTAPPAAAAN